MTIFEYLTVAVSLILALGLSKLVSSVPFVFHRERRDWLHILVFVLAISTHIVIWWNIWLLNEIPNWTIFQFAILMASPLSLYLFATALLSPDPSQVSDWKQYLAEHSFLVFASAVAVLFFSLMRNIFILGADGRVLPTVVFPLILMSTLLFGSFSQRRSVHASIIVLVYMFMTYVLVRNFVAS